MLFSFLPELHLAQKLKCVPNDNGQSLFLSSEGVRSVMHKGIVHFMPSWDMNVQASLNAVPECGKAPSFHHP